MAKDKENKTIDLHIRITPSLNAGLEKLANEDNRTLSDYVRVQLEKLVNNQKK